MQTFKNKCYIKEFMKSLKAKRGQVGGAMSGALGTIFVLFLIGILLFAFVLAGAQMKGSTTDTDAIEVINDTMDGAKQYSSFSPVLWIMAAIGVLLTIIFGAIAVYFFRR